MTNNPTELQRERAGDSPAVATIRREVYDALHTPRGVHVGLPKVRLDATHVQRLMIEFDMAKTLIAALEANTCPWCKLPGEQHE